MSTGVLYVMSTVVSGLIKIGKTTTDRFDSRMYELEHNGYRNVTGLRRRFAIEVENYDEKERILDDIFAKARVPGSELFVLDINLAIELLASFEGHQIYPKMSTESKSRIFDAAAKNHQENTGIRCIPEGTVRADVHFSSPSQAGAFATGYSCNGWAQWKTQDGQAIDIFRFHQNSSSQSLQ